MDGWMDGWVDGWSDTNTSPNIVAILFKGKHIVTAALPMEVVFKGLELFPLDRRK